MSTRDLGPATAVLLWVAVGLQGCLAFTFLVMGLGWAGVLYTANVVQGAAFLVVAVVLAVRRRVLALLVPVLSLVLCLGLQGADALLTARACSPAARAAVAELGLDYVVDDGDPFTYMLAFPSACSALFGARGRSVADVVADYRRAGQEAGWEVITPAGSSRVELRNARWTVEVQPYEDEDGLLELLVHRQG